MQKLKDKVLFTTAIALCVQFFAFDSLAVQIPPSLLPRFYSSVDSSNFQDVKAILYSVRAGALTNRESSDYIIDLEFRDAAGNTPLIRASAQGNINIINYLIQLGANINAYNNKYETPLITSYNTGNFEAAKYFISKGAIDNYQVAQRLKIMDEKTVTLAEVKTNSMPSSTKVVIGAGAIGAGGIAAAAALGAGGGGGGGGSSGSSSSTSTINNPASLDATTFVTTEAQAQEGVLAMNSNHAYARGYDGSIYNRNADGSLVDSVADGNVKVAVVDSGVDLTHADLSANILSANSVTCDNTGCVSGGDNIITDVLATSYGHGTAVAGIIAATKDSTGMHGVAYNSKIMSIGFADAAGNLTFGDTPGIKYAIDNGAQVINGSYGTAGSIRSYSSASINSLLDTSVGGTTLRSDYQSGVAGNVIFVYSSGNSSFVDPVVPAGLPYYFQGANPFTSGTADHTNYEAINPSHVDWSKNFLAVASVDNSNVISSFSNMCGVAKNWCLVAPGEVSKSTLLGGGYTGSISGTSFAAPNVSGAVAVLLGAFPHLTPEQVVRILLNTATDLGAVGVDDVYGYGLVNLQKATDPTDTGWSITTLGSSTPASFYSSGFGLSPAFGNALAHNNSSLVFLDGYGKDYIIPLSGLSENLKSNKTSFDKLSSFASSEFGSTVNLSELSSLRFSNYKEDEFDRTRSKNFTKLSFSSSSNVGKDVNLSFGFNYKASLANFFAATDDKKRPENLMASDAYKNPYVNTIGEAASTVIGYSSGGLAVKSAVYSGDAGGDYDYRFSNSKRTVGIYDEYSYTSKKSRTEISLNGGVMLEQNTILGSETSGAFGIDKSTTYHSGVSGRQELADGISLIGNYNIGVTSVSAASDSVFTNFDHVVSNSMAAGIEFSGVDGDGSVLGFTVSQPLRVVNASANLALPVDVAANGSVIYQNQNLNLAPVGRELDIEGYYHVALPRGGDFSLNSILRLAPNNDTSAQNEVAVLTKYSSEF